MIEKNWNYRNKKIVEKFLCEKYSQEFKMFEKYDMLIPQGVIFNLKEIEEMKIIKTDMAKKLIYNNELEVVKIGKKIHISRTELIRFLIANTIGANESKEGLE
jgi:hypothetical protein